MTGKQIIGALVALLIVAVAITVPTVIAMSNTAALQAACSANGGVWSNGVCGWSRPLGDRQAVITVEEDGSYAAGCVAGRPCDDTVRP